MQKISYLLLALIILSSCHTKKKTITNNQAQKNNQTIQKENKTTINNHTNYTADQYIDRFKSIAIQEMNTYGIPASIKLAQGLLESGFGNGELAKVANNHFGIKCTSDWKGKSYFKDDDQVNDCFRVYNKPEDSFRDHSEFLKRKRYASLFELDKDDYEGWAKGLKAAGYATNPQYPKLLIGIIERYNLSRFDRGETELEKIKREDRVLADINKNIDKNQNDASLHTPPDSKTYMVKPGDTLYSISKRFGLTVDTLKALNSIPDNTIKIGQALIIAQ
jgi:uncharacterized FlgJ-related protein